MADRHEDKDSDGAKHRSEGHSAAPSTRAVDEGLEGSIQSGSGSQGTHRMTGATGSGSEASEGIHAAQQGDRTPSDRSSVEGAARGSSGHGNVERGGSEPLPDGQGEHESGYGGRGGEPRTSSDQRE
jgi:hypothetical protein